MSSVRPGSSEAAALDQIEARYERRSRIVALLSELLPVPQGRVFELLQLLSEPVFDLNGVSNIVRNEPLLRTHVLALLQAYPVNSSHADELNFAESIVLLGSERLRILALGCAIAEYAGKHLPPETMRDFWQHSILTALISQRIAREAHPESAERAYLAGLLHDIGRLPLMIAAHERDGGAGDALTDKDEPGSEREHFGIDHSEVGRWIAVSGNLPAWMVEVVAHHHDISRAVHDPAIVSVVSAADECSHVPNIGQSRAGTTFWSTSSVPEFGAN
jgi:putative nucleotidyltransferase with HDIG domain